ncbi:MAG: hypothetical protein JSS52_11495 [Proteobacteria bacterium]|nr:hypothetical protein [Pseudomonadota bacterium]
MITAHDLADAAERRWVQRFEAHLDQVPVLIEFLRGHRVPLQAGSLNERVTGGGGEAPVPFRLDPVDDADDLWAALIEYTTEVGERLHMPLPHSGNEIWRANTIVQGIPAHLGANGARRAVFPIVAWLIDHAPRIHPLELTDSEDHLFTLIRNLSARYVVPPIDRPAHRRVCTVCGEQAVRVAWLLGGTGEAECGTCGATYAPEGNENS